MIRQTYGHDQSTITITIDAATLRMMEANEIAFHYTPGVSQAYLSNGPIFRYDFCIATAQDFLAGQGYDESDGIPAEEELTITVALDD